MVWDQTPISRLSGHEQILVQQNIAIMCAVCQIIDDHELPDAATQDPLPSRINAIVIRDQPVGAETGQRVERLRRVSLDTDPEHSGIYATLDNVRGIRTRQPPDRNSDITQSRVHMALELPRDEQDLVAGFAQSLGERQTSGNVSVPHTE